MVVSGRDMVASSWAVLSFDDGIDDGVGAIASPASTAMAEALLHGVQVKLSRQARWSDDVFARFQECPLRSLIWSS